MTKLLIFLAFWGLGIGCGNQTFHEVADEERTPVLSSLVDATKIKFIRTQCPRYFCQNVVIKVDNGVLSLQESIKSLRQVGRKDLQDLERKELARLLTALGLIGQRKKLTPGSSTCGVLTSDLPRYQLYWTQSNLAFRWDVFAGCENRPDEFTKLVSWFDRYLSQPARLREVSIVSPDL